MYICLDVQRSVPSKNCTSSNDGSPSHAQIVVATEERSRLGLKTRRQNILSFLSFYFSFFSSANYILFPMWLMYGMSDDLYPALPVVPFRLARFFCFCVATTRLPLARCALHFSVFRGMDVRKAICSPSTSPPPMFGLRIINIAPACTAVGVGKLYDFIGRDNRLIPFEGLTLIEAISTGEFDYEYFGLFFPMR